jgi:hypothetical protein
MREIRASDFGLRPGENATPALRRLSQTVAGEAEAHILIEPGTYLITDWNDEGTHAPQPFELQGIGRVVVEARGANFRTEGGYITVFNGAPGPNRFPWIGLVARDVKELVVLGYSFDGGADRLIRGNYVPIDLDDDGREDLRFVPHHELQAHGMLLSAVESFTLDDVHIHGAICDGFCLAGTVLANGSMVLNHDGVMRRCSALHCGRNGLSAVQVRRLRVYDSEFSHTGRSQYGGHAPGAGIDVERDRWVGDGGANEPTENTGDIEFHNCRIVDNVLRTVVVGYQTQDTVSFKGCLMEGHTQASDYETYVISPGSTLIGCTIRTRHLGLGHLVSAGDPRRAQFVDNRIELIPGGKWIELLTNPVSHNVLFARNEVVVHGPSQAFGMQIRAANSWVIDNLLWIDQSRYNAQVPFAFSMLDCENTIFRGNLWQTNRSPDAPGDWWLLYDNPPTVAPPDDRLVGGIQRSPALP